jgi:hypothetical protein
MSRIVRDGRSNYKGGRDGEEEQHFEQIGWRDWLGGAMLVTAALYSARLEASHSGTLDASAHG